MKYPLLNLSFLISSELLPLIREMHFSFLVLIGDATQFSSFYENKSTERVKFKHTTTRFQLINHK